MIPASRSRAITCDAASSGGNNAVSSEPPAPRRFVGRIVPVKFSTRRDAPSCKTLDFARFGGRQRRCRHDSKNSPGSTNARAMRRSTEG